MMRVTVGAGVGVGVAPVAVGVGVGPTHTNGFVISVPRVQPPRAIRANQIMVTSTMAKAIMRRMDYSALGSSPGLRVTPTAQPLLVLMIVRVSAPGVVAPAPICLSPSKLFH